MVWERLKKGDEWSGYRLAEDSYIDPFFLATLYFHIQNPTLHYFCFSAGLPCGPLPPPLWAFASLDSRHFLSLWLTVWRRYQYIYNFPTTTVPVVITRDSLPSVNPGELITPTHRCLPVHTAGTWNRFKCFCVSIKIQLIICLHPVKWSNSSICNNLIRHKSFFCILFKCQNSIGSIYRTLSGTINLSQCGPGSNGNVEGLHNLQSSRITRVSPSDYLTSYRTLILHIYKEAVGVFYSPSRLGLNFLWCKCILSDTQVLSNQQGLTCIGSVRTLNAVIKKPARKDYQ